MAEGGNVIFKFLGDDKQLKGVLGSLGNAAKTALSGLAVGTAAVTAGFAAIVTESVKARGEMEQLAGGVEKIFGESANIVQENAEKAYKTAGISAQKYMEQVTSFSASLLQSLGGDTEEAARIADQAIIDMADNANTFGTSIDSIQAAYQGFAKQNYTMLDNLKLGYGGTKTEMERLLKDAQKISGIKYDISNLNDVYEAIHVIQEEMNISGTTAKEAEKTLTGSIASLQASWQNFLSGTGNLGDVVGSAKTAFTNILRIVEDALPDIMENIYDWLPELIELGTEILGTIGQSILDNLPMLMEMAINILNGLITGLSENMDTLIPKIVEIVLLITDTLIDHLPELIEGGVKLLSALIIGIVKAIPQLIEKAPEIISSLVTALKELGPELLQAGKDLLKELGNGLKEAVPQLLLKIGEISVNMFNKFKEGFTDLIDKAKNWGKDLIEGFINGIKEKWEALKQSVADTANAVASYLHFSRPDVRTIKRLRTMAT